MNFFDRQDNARKTTRYLVLLFILAVVAITLAVNLIVIAAVANMGTEEGQVVVPDGAWLADNLTLIIGTSIAVVVLIASASFYRMARLRGGGGVVAQSMGGTQISPDTRDPQRRMLRNVVEEIAIASGVPVPDIYVLEKEAGINAFAAGYGSEDAAVAVSRGCLEKLRRDELQGVIAHEFSHIFNGDMRLNIRLMGILFGILMIGIAGRQILRLGYYGGSRKNGAPLAAVGLGLLLVGFIGLFFGRLIQAAVSRQREYLADASAVQFTRHPDGIGGALKKIAASDHGAILEADGEEVGHMLFADGVGRKVMATHPPILDRIRAVDPHFNPGDLRDIAARMALKPDTVDAEADDKEERRQGFGVDVATAVATAGVLIAEVGNPSWDKVAYAAALLDQLPDELDKGAHDDRRAIDVVLALLVDNRPAVRDRQLELIESDMGGAHRQHVAGYLDDVGQLDPRDRLPLIELALPVLKRRPKAALSVYLAVIRKLIRADGEVDVFEYALSRLVSVYLVQALKSRQDDGEGRIGRLHSVKDELAVLFAVVADVGHEDHEVARRAFSDGLDHLFPMDSVDYQPPEDWVGALDDAMDKIDRLLPLPKEQVIEGLIQTLIHDHQITLAELELLRAICASLHCPMPPQIEAK